MMNDYAILDPGYFLGDHGGFGPDGLSGLDLGSFPPSGLAYLHLQGPPPHRGAPPPPGAAELRNDLGSNISVLKTLNLRFRCFLAKVHELERRNKLLEKQLQQALEGGGGAPRPLTKEMGVQTGFIGPIPARPGLIPLHNANNAAYLPGGLLSPTLNPPPLCDNKPLGAGLRPGATDSNCNLTSPGFPSSPALSPSDPSRTIANGNATGPPPPQPRFLPGAIWSFNPTRRFGRDSCAAGPPGGLGGPWAQPDGVGVQVDTITPEIRALKSPSVVTLTLEDSEERKTKKKKPALPATESETGLSYRAANAAIPLLTWRKP
ncbi:Intermediate filament family orphan 1 [Liparis tanakae]|uniref:Intermediate filament family orphan 1 n=1 Tax=Liparis tanakae TaxID=230148 RepID=A0A4Z2GX74_9TELE|nr:Intermediate filament family orphan 1 [Liparis tanakae]